jgi:hypothetical protein
MLLIRGRLPAFGKAAAGDTHRLDVVEHALSENRPSFWIGSPGRLFPIML